MNAYCARISRRKIEEQFAKILNKQGFGQLSADAFAGPLVRC
jgi:hypothetical protein